MAEGRARCACGGKHPWRAAGIDDPEALATPAAHAAAAARPAFAGATRKLAHATRWFAEDQAKDLIVLHYTEGGLPTWWDTCNTRWEAGDAAPAISQGVGSTAFGVGRDGTVEEYYPPECWSHHATAGTAVHRRSIGIELANLGWAFELTDAQGEVTGHRTRCATLGATLQGFVAAQDLPADVQEVLPAHYRQIAWDRPREVTHWHAFPDAQLDALVGLVDRLCTRFGIPRVVLPLDVRHQQLWPRGAGAGVARGIVCHANFVHVQPDCSEKWDVGPAFPWERLAARLGASLAPIGGRTAFAAPAGVGARDALMLAEASSPVVRKLERQLNYLGFPCGRADGITDAQTRAGITRFQQAHAARGYAADGKLTDALVAHVDELYRASGGPEAERRAAVARAAQTPLSILEKLRRERTRGVSGGAH